MPYISLEIKKPENPGEYMTRFKLKDRECPSGEILNYWDGEKFEMTTMPHSKNSCLLDWFYDAKHLPLEERRTLEGW